MYEPIYSTYYGKIGIENRTLAVGIVPCFGTKFTKFENDKMYWCVNGEILKDETSGEKEIFIDPKTQWLVKEGRYNSLDVYITEYTKTLQTPFGDEVNKIINREVKAAQKEYNRRKKTEKRLYFYDAPKSRLRLYTDGTSSYYGDQCRYRLDRLFTSYQALDKRYPVPKESCFILGKVRRTIGTKDEKLMDFIEPVAEFKLNYEEEDYFFGNEEERLGNEIFKMLQFSILKDEPTGLTAARIQNKMHCNVQEFLEELNTALEEGDVEKVRLFYDVVNEPQDCSEQKFILTKDEFGKAFEEGEELWCGISKKLRIYYENGEDEAKEASWIFRNISRCTNKIAVYLEKEQKYNFY